MKQASVAVLTADAEAERADGTGRALGGTDAAVGAQRSRQRRRRIGDGGKERSVEIVKGGEMEIVEIGVMVERAAAEVIGNAVTRMKGPRVNDGGVVNPSGAGSAEIGREKHEEESARGRRKAAARVKAPRGAPSAANRLE